MTRLDTSLGIMTMGLSMLIVFLGALLSFRNGFATPSQMQLKGVRQGLPFIAHGGMWGDVFIISPLLGIMVGLYSREWVLSDWIAAGSVSLVVSCIMHWTYTAGNLQGAHIQNYHLTNVGWIHFVYMTAALTVIILFYFFTEHPIPWLVKWASGLLIIHVIIGTHTVLRVYTRIKRLSWFPLMPIVDFSTGLTVAGCTTLLIWRLIYLI